MDDPANNAEKRAEAMRHLQAALSLLDEHDADMFAAAYIRTAMDRLEMEVAKRRRSSRRVLRQD